MSNHSKKLTDSKRTMILLLVVRLNNGDNCNVQHDLMLNSLILNIFSIMVKT